METFRIEVGHAHGVQPGNIVGAIANEADLESRYIGRIDIRAGANLQDTCVAHGFPGTDTIVEEDGHIGHGAVLHGCIVRRNALVALGNTGGIADLPLAEPFLASDDELLREQAEWTVARIEERHAG